MRESLRRRLIPVLIIASLTALAASATQPPRFERRPDGVIVPGPHRVLKISFQTANIVRVSYAPSTADFVAPSLSVIAKPMPVSIQIRKSDAGLEVRSSRLIVRVHGEDVAFFDLAGHPVMSEVPGSKSLQPVTLPGLVSEHAYASHDTFHLQPGEGIYGLGQHQAGFLDYRGTTVNLEQHNMEVAIPFFVSSQGYGLLWDNPAYTSVSVQGVPPTAVIDTGAFADDNGSPGLTGHYFDGVNFDRLVGGRNDSKIDTVFDKGPMNGLEPNNYSIRWTGSLKAPRDGMYTFSTRSDDGVRLFIDGKKLIEDWNQHPPRDDFATVQLKKGSHAFKMEYFQGSGGAEIHLSWAKPAPPAPPTIDIHSEASRMVDYYFVYGPSLEQVISSYRGLTGQAPLPGKWAMGFWQSKERYNTQQEWIDIAQQYRDKQEPIDDIVQDWFYWNPAPWGSHWFNPERYPDPAAGVAELHDRFHDHIMISVWGKFDTAKPDDPQGENYRTLNNRGMLYPGLNYYDAFDPEARRVYWDLMDQDIFHKGFDAWWLDASEPELDMQQFRKTMTAQGLGARLLNAWPLEHTKGVYEHQRAETSRKRVFILTRSAYAGQQRNGAATWSGDITASWDVFAHQIPAGLNFCLSGIPYWTTDIGAFFVPSFDFPGGSANPQYRELFTRWFQFGAFCPIFRVHGTDTPKELWRFGPNEPILAKYDKLRYRLMPYIYSQCWQVTHSGSTMMRALVMDFRNDKVARELKDEFMFGPSILVAPVTKPGVKTRQVYLPAGTDWYDFWTNKRYTGGHWIAAAAPIDTLPLFVKAGAIIPMGPDVQWTGEKPDADISINVYPGADGHFTLYEDAGDTYDYEKGAYATTELAWSDRMHKVQIAPTVGKYRGMSNKRRLLPKIVR